VQGCRDKTRNLITIVVAILMTKKLKIAFPFVLESLDSLDPVIRPMFGCHAVYVGTKLVLITRDKNSNDGDEGVWIATKVEHHASLREEIPSMRSIKLLANGKETNWQNIPKDSDSFEEEVLQLLELIRKNDPRIGTVPAKKPQKKATRKRSGQDRSL
jgi:hypothetical protein